MSRVRRGPTTSIALVDCIIGTYIKVIKSQLLKSVIKSRLDILWPMAVVPQLAGNEDILTLQARDFCKGLLDSFSDLDLVLVDLGEIKMPIANLEGLVNTLANDTRGGLPSAITQSWELVTGVEENGASERHFDVLSSKGLNRSSEL